MLRAQVASVEITPTTTNTIRFGLMCDANLLELTAIAVTGTDTARAVPMVHLGNGAWKTADNTEIAISKIDVTLRTTIGAPLVQNCVFNVYDNTEQNAVSQETTANSEIVLSAWNEQKLCIWEAIEQNLEQMFITSGQVLGVTEPRLSQNRHNVWLNFTAMGSDQSRTNLALVIRAKENTHWSSFSEQIEENNTTTTRHGLRVNESMKMSDVIALDGSNAIITNIDISGCLAQ
jgi:hypothetical protein